MKKKKDYEKEIEIMKNIKNKYIIELKDYFCDEANEGYCIVMELCDGNLRQILKISSKWITIKYDYQNFYSIKRSFKNNDK